MTATEKLARAERWRIGTAHGWNGVFVVPVDGDLWQVILVADGHWRHLAAANFYRNQRASHNVAKRLRDYFFSDNAWVVEFYPPPAASIGAEATLHLWESIEAEMPIPLDHAYETHPSAATEPEARPAEPPIPETPA